MLFFSEIKGKNVVTQDEIVVGKLEDIIFKFSEKPFATKLVVRSKKNREKLIIPIDDCLKINNKIILEKNFQNASGEENEFSLVKNILDKQIIDIHGYKLVRANDIAIQRENNQWILVGVDIGWLGIARWLRLEDIIIKILGLLKIKISSDFLSWGEIQPLDLLRGEIKLKRAEEKLKKIKPEDLADYLETTTIHNVKKFLDLLDEKQAIAVLNNLNLNYQSNLIKTYSDEKAAYILSLIDVDEAVDILLTFPKKRRETIINLIKPEIRREINHLLQFASTSIGDYLTTEYLTVFPDDTATEVIQKIKKETVDFYHLYNIYVVNQEKQLIGVFNLHELLLQDPATPVFKFMIPNLVVIHLTTSKEIAIKKMIKYKLMNLPVIDNEKRMVGIVIFDDLFEENGK
jgi:CBS domain-containing protein/sporulation protein YlmC with PRC-barrel domain